jgi:hypothetical protein
MKDKYYRKNKASTPSMTMYIQDVGTDLKTVIDMLVDPAPTIFESSNNVEVRFNIELNNENYLKYHALNHLENKDIVIGIIYDNEVELKSTFKVTNYERRFGSNKGSIVTHVMQGIK